MRINHTIAALLLTLLASCGHNDSKDAEDAEEDKVGKIYNPKVQGIDMENRDNQFPSSRNDNREGTGQETGAPSDTVDGDGDKVKVNDQPK